MNQGASATEAETRASRSLMLREMSDYTIAVAIIEADEAVAQHRRTADEFRAEFQRRITETPAARCSQSRGSRSSSSPAP